MSNELNSNTFTQEEEGIKFSDLWAMFWDFKLWYVLALVLSLALAFFYLYKTPKEYSTSAQVMIDETTQAATMKNLGLDGLMDMRSSQSIENELVAFSSPDLMVQVVNRLGLETKYFEHQPLRTVELYGNSPLEMVIADNNLHSGFSVEMEQESPTAVRLNKFYFRSEEIETDIIAELGDTVITPVGALAFHPKDEAFEMEHRMTVSWTPALYAARGYKRVIPDSRTDFDQGF